MKNKIKDILIVEKGSALVLAMMVLLVLSILGATIGVITVGSYRLADTSQNSNSAYYIAEAGANMAYEEIESYVLKAYEESDSQGSFFKKMEKPLGEYNDKNSVLYKDEFDTQLGEQPKATVTILHENTEGSIKELTIKSIGEITNKKRIVDKRVVIKWKDKTDNEGNEKPNFPSETAIMFRGNLILFNDSVVKGDVRYKGGNLEMHHRVVHEGSIFNQETINWEKYKRHINEVLQSPYKSIDNSQIINSNHNSNLNIPVESNLEGDLYTRGDIYIDSRSKIKGDIISGGNIEINTEFNGQGILFSEGNISINSRSKIEGDLIASGNIIINNDSKVKGDIFAGGNIQLRDRLETEGRIFTKGNLIIQNDSVIIGNLLSFGNITVGDRSIVQYKKYVNNSPVGSTNINKEDLISSQPAIESD